tara:strand:- start:403 stop:534 length:132 start_codon:yes stop_codon:yes gene_type:complete
MGQFFKEGFKLLFYIWLIFAGIVMVSVILQIGMKFLGQALWPM